MRKSVWIPLPEVSEHTEGQISVGNMGLPVGFDIEGLSLNVGRLSAGVIDWGGYESVVIKSYRGDSDEVNVGIGGSDADGSAYATGAVATTRAESSSLKSTSDQLKNALDIRNGELEILTNSQALKGRVETDKLYDPKTWSQFLNRQIKRQAIAGIARHNSTERFLDRNTTFYEPSDKFMTGAVLAMSDLGPANVGLLFGTVTNANAPETLVAGGISMVLFQSLRSAIRIKRLGIDKKDSIADPVLYSARTSRISGAVSTIIGSKMVKPTPIKNS